MELDFNGRNTDCRFASCAIVGTPFTVNGFFEKSKVPDLDDIFTEVFNARVNAEKREEGEKDERIKINDIITKKEKDQEDAEAIELAVNKMHHGKINTGGPDRNGDEAKVAQIIYKLRNEDLTAEEEKAYRDMIDPSIEGSLADIAAV